MVYLPPENRRIIRSDDERERAANDTLISTLVGEMPGRAEGGTLRSINLTAPRATSLP